MRLSALPHALLLVAVLATPAAAGARQEAKVVTPSDPAARATLEQWGYSQAIVSGDTIYVSGVVAGLRDGETDLQAAYARAFDRLGAVLAEAGASWDDVVDMTSFHTDLTSQIPAIIAVKQRYIKTPYPAWTAIQVARLIPDRGITEIKLVARVRK